MAIYTPDKCLIRLDIEYRIYFDLTFLEYQKINNCENCCGREEKDCKILFKDITLKFSIKGDND